MNAKIKHQLDLFEKILKRELTELEKYLIKNSFMNGHEVGVIYERERLGGRL